MIPVKVTPGARQLYFEQLWESHRELSDPAVAEARWQFFAISNTTPADYIEQAFQLTLPSLPAISGWTGIRFRNLDVGTPFVTVSLNTNPQILLQPEHLQILRQELAPRFARFSPHGFTLRIPVPLAHREALQKMPQQAPTATPHQVWSTYWLRRFKDLTPAVSTEDSARSASSSPIVLSPLHSLEDPRFDYERFQAQHQLWRLLHQNLAPWVEAASAEELAESGAHDLCYLAHTPQHEPIGLVAGQRDNYYGLPGVSILELFVYPTYQGKGYGKALQSLFQQQLMAQGHMAIWGSIHAENEASWRTARACGRRLVEQECFFPFETLVA